MRAGPWALARTAAVNLSLVLASLLVCLAAGEGYLRLFHPVYEYAAEFRYDFDRRRIFARRAHSMSNKPHPDTGMRHVIIHNNLALRQHRDFSEDDLADAVNIGVFGDSFTENVRLPSPYSFTEVLDYLLTLPSRDNEAQDRINVLNLGTERYATDQLLLHYEDFRYASDLDVVLYVFCRNDPRGIYENGLFHLDETGALTRNPAIGRSPWISLLSRLHMTYLVIDGTRRLAILAKGKVADSDEFLEASEDINVELLRQGREERLGSAEAMALEADVVDGEAESELAKDAVVVFRSLLRTWQQMVQERGGRFVVAILPRPVEDRMAAMIPPEIDTVNLFECFNEHVAEYSYAPDWRFVNDAHWNEQGNMLAAVCLYRFLERELNLPVRSLDELLEQLHRYYAAFQDEGRRNHSTTPTSTRPRDSVDIDRLEQPHRFTFQAWMPPEEWTRPTSVQPGDLAAIRSKYLAREISRTSQISRLLGHGRLVARSTFDLYLDEDRLIYVRTSCAPADTEARFFLHVHPADVNALPVVRQQYGFDNLDFDFDVQGLMFDDDMCVASARLPRYDIVRISTGQFVFREGRTWHAEFAFGAGRASPSTPGSTSSADTSQGGRSPSATP